MNRKGRSTTSNLIILVSDVLCVMEKGYQVEIVCTAFSKAFDRIDYGILISKLYISGPILNWLDYRSYLFIELNSLNIMARYLIVFSYFLEYHRFRFSSIYLYVTYHDYYRIQFKLFYADELKLCRSIKMHSTQNFFSLSSNPLKCGFPFFTYQKG